MIIYSNNEMEFYSDKYNISLRFCISKEEKNFIIIDNLTSDKKEVFYVDENRSQNEMIFGNTLSVVEFDERTIFKPKYEKINIPYNYFIILEIIKDAGLTKEYLKLIYVEDLKYFYQLIADLMMEIWYAEAMLNSVEFPDKIFYSLESFAMVKIK